MDIFVFVLQTSLVFMNSVLGLNDEHIAWDFYYFLLIQVLLKIGVRKNEREKKKTLVSISLKSCWPVSWLRFCHPAHSFHFLLSAVDMDINKAQRLLLKFFGIQANNRILMENLLPALLEHRFKRKVINQYQSAGYEVLYFCCEEYFYLILRTQESTMSRMRSLEC